MAEKEIEITLKWENNVSFEMTTKEDGGQRTVVKADENGHIGDIWPHLEGICKLYILKILKEIGDEMKVE